MPDFDTLLGENLGATFAILLGFIAVLIGFVAVQSARLRRAVRGYRDLVRDDRAGPGGSLHELLAAHAEQIERAGRRMTEMEEVHEILVRRTDRSIQHVGLVRFNPFEDTGSDQSFVVALLDAQRDGLVISSLHGRGSTRVFAKPISAGMSTHQLSNEEAEAIRVALEDTDRHA